MNLGKTIVEYRTKMNLSQGDLAERLNVSRQSVSKWENNVAVPDLDKIIKLSEIFGISLDELVKGSQVKNEEPVQIIKEIIIQEPKREGRKTAGIILFCMAFAVFALILVLTGSIGGILYSVPFIVCGTICFLFKEHTGLWCIWALVLMADAFMRMAMGITIGMIRHTLIWTRDMNYARLAIAWIFLGILCLIIVITILTFSKKSLKINDFTNKHLLFGWIGWSVIFILHHVLVRTQFYANLMSSVISMPMLFYLISMLSEWFRTGWLLYMIIYSLRVRHTRKIQSEVLES